MPHGSVYGSLNKHVTDTYGLVATHVVYIYTQSTSIFTGFVTCEVILQNRAGLVTATWILVAVRLDICCQGFRGSVTIHPCDVYATFVSEPACNLQTNLCRCEGDAGLRIKCKGDGVAVIGAGFLACRFEIRLCVAVGGCGNSAGGIVFSALVVYFDVTSQAHACSLKEIIGVVRSKNSVLRSCASCQCPCGI